MNKQEMLDKLYEETKIMRAKKDEEYLIAKNERDIKEFKEAKEKEKKRLEKQLKIQAMIEKFKKSVDVSLKIAVIIFLVSVSFFLVTYVFTHRYEKSDRNQVFDRFKGEYKR